jgi:NADH-quinone oxidoreductase subunit G
VRSEVNGDMGSDVTHVDAAADLVGEARPGWRVLRVLGNELELPNCDYRTPSDVAAVVGRELEVALAPVDTLYKGSFAPSGRTASVNGVALDVPIYAIDMLVRRSEPLQETVLGRQGVA